MQIVLRLWDGTHPLHIHVADVRVTLLPFKIPGYSPVSRRLPHFFSHADLSAVLLLPPNLSITFKKRSK